MLKPCILATMISPGLHSLFSLSSVNGSLELSCFSFLFALTVQTFQASTSYEYSFFSSSSPSRDFTAQENLVEYLWSRNIRPTSRNSETNHRVTEYRPLQFQLVFLCQKRSQPTTTPLLIHPLTSSYPVASC